MAEIRVTIEGRAVGIVERSERSRLRFAYDDAWLQGAQATPISVSLPLRRGWFDHDVITPYLWGLLPDNDQVIERWASEAQCSPTDIVGLLRSVGGDVAGAAQYYAPDAEAEEGTEGFLDWIDEDDVARLLRAMAADSTAWRAAASAGRWSLAGAQAKIALAHDPERGWAVPHGRTPTTHILKPSISWLADHDLNELLCVRAASKLGLVTEEATLGRFADTRVLVVVRYDRLHRDGDITRVHQEDFCQALGVHPRQKYQTEGGPGVEDMVELLRASGSSPEVDSRRLCEAVAYSWLTLGTDAHAKNYSLLLSGKQVRLAPLYDLQSAAPFVPYPPKALLAQKIGGEYRAGQISTRHWIRLAATAGLDPDDLLSRIHDMATAIPDALADAASEADLDPPERANAAAIVDQIAAWTASCRTVIDPPPAPSPPPTSAPAARTPKRRSPAGSPRGGQFTSPPPATN